MNKKKSKLHSTDNNLQSSPEFEKIVKIIKNLIEVDSILFYKFDEINSELILKNSYNLPEKTYEKIKIDLNEKMWNTIFKNTKPIIQKVSLKNKIINKFFNLIDDFKTFIVIPANFKNKTTGLLLILSKKLLSEDSKNFSLFNLLAEFLVSPFIISSLNEEIKKSSILLDRITKVSRAIVSNNYLKEILQLIVTTTAEILNSKIVSLMLLDESRQELFIEATQSLSEEYVKKPPLKVGESISGKALQEKRPIVVLDVTKEPGYKYPEIAKKEGLVSLLAVPMMVKDKAIGVINCYTAEEHKFTEEEINILQSVANQAAIAIENTKLMQEILAAREALETRKLIERAKGILMKELNLDEESAYKIIHKLSMNKGKPMKEIAEAIILTEEIKKKEIK